MMRSLYSGISGLRNHQTRMDVIGNNIANVNTAGYKTARVIFQDIFSQNVSSGMANQGNIGGTNPMQIGLGIRLSSVDVIHSRAAFGRTDRETDMMINGDGFFIVMQQNPLTGEEEYLYTRAGNFVIDDEGYLVTSHGYYVMGYTVPVEMGMVSFGEWSAGPPEGYIKDPVFGLTAKANVEATGQVGLERIRVKSNEFRPVSWNAIGNLPGGAAHQAAIRTLLVNIETMYDALVVAQNNLKNDPQDVNLQIALQNAYQDYFDAQDDLTDYFDNNLDAEFPYEEVGLPGFAVANNGDVSVIIANRGVVIGRIGIAMFANPEGLEKAGNSLYRETASSGPVVVTEAYMEGAGQIDAGGLEMSNVDMATEFTDMIVTQRGFQANSRIITVSDTLLEELVNLKR